jgi:hypothetical protein
MLVSSVFSNGVEKVSLILAVWNTGSSPFFFWNSRVANGRFSLRRRTIYKKEDKGYSKTTGETNSYCTTVE